MKNIAFFAMLLGISMYSQEGLSQVAINSSGSVADQSAILDVNATDKGMLIPRVSLNGIANNIVPVANPAVGLLVYNTTGNDLLPGIYMWNGMSWSPLATMDQVINAIPPAAGANVYGELYEYHPVGAYSNISIPSSGTYVSWSTATQGNISNMSYGSSTIIAENTGTYSVSFNATFQLSMGGKLVEAALFVNGVRQDDMHCRNWSKEGSKSNDLSFSGIITLNADDVVSVRFTMDDSSTLRLELANLSVSKLD